MLWPIAVVIMLMLSQKVYSQQQQQQQSEPTIVAEHGNLQFTVGLEADVYVVRQSNVSGAIQSTNSPVVTLIQLEEAISNISAIFQQALQQESSRALSAETRLQEVLSQLSSSTSAWQAEATSSTAVVHASQVSLAVSLSAEISQAISSNDNMVWTEQSRAGVAESALSAQLSQELTRSSIVEGSLAENVAQLLINVQTEISRASGAESSLASSQAMERTRAMAAELSISSYLGQVESRVTITETSLGFSISNEVQRASSAELTLTSNVNHEVSRATIVENSLATSILDEKNRATSEESSLSVLLTNEVSRASAEENTLNSALQSEVTQASEVEASLSSSLSKALAQSMATESSISSVLAQEISASTNIYGRSVTNPASSCMDALKHSRPANAGVNGVYYINYNDGNGVVPVYCDQTSYDGGWDLIMKMGEGTTFNYGSTYWSTTAVLGEKENLDATFGSDNKYYGYNSGQYNEVLARFSYNGYEWDWPITSMKNSPSTITPLNFFNGPQLYLGNQISSPYFTNGATFGQNKWSAQGGYQNFGVNNCCNSNACIRFGFVWNNENDCGSNDVSSGIGMNTGEFRGYSVGDAIGCCQSVTGTNTAFSAQLFARSI